MNDIEEKRHAEVLRQMKIANVATGIIATSALIGLITLVMKKLN